MRAGPPTLADRPSVFFLLHIDLPAYHVNDDFHCDDPGKDGNLCARRRTGRRRSLFGPTADQSDRTCLWRGPVQRKLVPRLLRLSALILCGASIASRFSVLLAALACVGLSTVSAKILAPLGGELAQPEQRGRVVGTIAAGSISGILLSRTVSGLIADLDVRRTIYAVAAVLAAAVAVPMRASLPRLVGRAYEPYPRLLRSVFTTVAEYRAALVTLLICAANFALLSLLWTVLTYLLSAPPFVHGTSRIGGFGLAGLAGVLAARRAGLLHDRGWSVMASGPRSAYLR